MYDQYISYDDLFIFVQETKQIIRISEGTGDNLLREDIEAGYKDYIYYDQYELDVVIQSVDGGIILIKEINTKSLTDYIPEVLEMAYDSSAYKYIILKR